MAHFQDLSACDYLPETAGLGFLAVGWLEPDHEFKHGDVPLEYFERLCSLLQDPWIPPVVCAGVHHCSFCRFTGGGRSSFRDYVVDAIGCGFLFIPSGRTLFVSPSSIAHYIDAHGYSPPVEFQQSVMSCPEMRSLAYKRALLDTPAREWLKRLNVPFA